MSGEACILQVSPSTLGRDVRKMVAEQLPPKRGAMCALHHLDSLLLLHQTLQEQGILSQTATLSCTYIPTDLHTAWRYVVNMQVTGEEFALEGITQIAGAFNT